jgi:hypothetical protein
MPPDRACVTTIVDSRGGDGAHIGRSGLSLSMRLVASDSFGTVERAESFGPGLRAVAVGDAGVVRDCFERTCRNVLNWRSRWHGQSRLDRSRLRPRSCGNILSIGEPLAALD